MSRAYGQNKKRKLVVENKSCIEWEAIPFTSREALVYRRMNLDVAFYTHATCPSCEYSMTRSEITRGRLTSERDVTTSCPECDHRFVAMLVPYYPSLNMFEDNIPFWSPEQTTYYYTVKWQTTPPMDFTLSNIQRSCKTLYWNLRLHYKMKSKSMEEVFVGKVVETYGRYTTSRKINNDELDNDTATGESDTDTTDTDRLVTDRDNGLVLPDHFWALSDAPGVVDLAE
jgi:hypothetical protein